jgi:peroxiredoxin
LIADALSIADALLIAEIVVTPIIGDTAPLFALPTQRGVSTSLADVLQQRGAAIIAFPGRVSGSGGISGGGISDGGGISGGGISGGGISDGGGIGNEGGTRRGAADRRIRALARVHEPLQDAGIALLVIVPDRQDAAKRFVEEVGTPFHLLCDDGEVTRRYGVFRRSLPWLRRDARPALFGIDAGGRIRYRFLADWHADPRALQDAIDILSLRKTNRPDGS